MGGRGTKMLYNEFDMRDYEVAVKTALLEDDQLMDEIMSELEEESIDIDNNRKPIFFRGKFTTIDPFWEFELEDEVFGTTFEKMIANFHKQIEYHVRVAKTYGHITPEKAARLAYETLEILEYYE